MSTPRLATIICVLWGVALCSLSVESSPSETNKNQQSLDKPSHTTFENVKQSGPPYEITPGKHNDTEEEEEEGEDPSHPQKGNPIDAKNETTTEKPMGTKPAEVTKSPDKKGDAATPSQTFNTSNSTKPTTIETTSTQKTSEIITTTPKGPQLTTKEPSTEHNEPTKETSTKSPSTSTETSTGKPHEETTPPKETTPATTLHPSATPVEIINHTTTKPSKANSGLTNEPKGYMYFILAILLLLVTKTV